MIVVDASGLTGPFSITQSDDVAFATGTFTPSSYTWSPTNTIITASGNLGDFTGAPSGTVSDLTIRKNGSLILLEITGLNNPLTDFIDASNADNSREKFWNTALAGDTTILTPTAATDFFSLAGDGNILINNGTTTGGNDHFQGSQTTITDPLSAYAGDYAFILGNDSLIGGDDTFTDVLGVIYGDVFDTLDSTLIGGSDTITSVDRSPIAQRIQSPLYADATSSTGLGTLIGGDDTVTLTNLASTFEIFLDMWVSSGALIGGNDTLLVETTITGRNSTFIPEIFGDADQVTSDQYGDTSTVLGGDDTIKLGSSNALEVYADFNDVTNRNAIGGNDTVLMEATVPLDPVNPVAGNSAVDLMHLDIDSFTTTGTNSFTGGDDTLTLINTPFLAIYGDAATTTGPDAVLRGGNDVINVTFDLGGVFTGAFTFADLAVVSSPNTVFGDDVINIDAVSSIPTARQIFADAGVISSTSTNAHTMIFGDDTINALGNVSNFVFGDASSSGIEFATPSAVVFGDDTINAGDGNDVIHGDLVFGATLIGVSAQSGGDDIIDGGLGDDFIDGGIGTNTASFARIDQAVTVMLQGIPGTGAPGLLSKNAIGQGSDFLINIQNVLGSSQSDQIVGDANDNVLAGLAGDDSLSGGSQNDTILPGLGNDTVEGGSGSSDTVSYADLFDTTPSRNTFGVRVSLADQGSVQVTRGNPNRDPSIGAGNDLLIGFENLTGSGGVDNLFGDANDNILRGLENADALTGAGGNDTIFGGAGSDILVGGAGADVLYGGDGIPNLDRASWRSEASGVIFDFTTPFSTLGNRTSAVVKEDTVFGIEGWEGSFTQFNEFDAADQAQSYNFFGGQGGNVMYGGDGGDGAGLGRGDGLVGFNGVDSIFGNEGGDIIWGRRSDDYLDAGRTADGTATDGDADQFNFEQRSGNDTVANFEVGLDRVFINPTNLDDTASGAANDGVFDRSDLQFSTVNVGGDGAIADAQVQFTAGNGAFTSTITFLDVDTADLQTNGLFFFFG